MRTRLLLGAIALLLGAASPAAVRAQVPPQDPCAVDVRVDVVGAEQAATPLALLAWSPSALVAPSPAGTIAQPLVMSSHALQSGAALATRMGRRSWFSIINGDYSGSYVANGFEEGTPDSTIAFEVDGSTNMLHVNVGSPSGCAAAGGPANCVLVTVTCKNAPCSSRSVSGFQVIRKDGAGQGVESLQLPVDMQQDIAYRYYFLTPREPTLLAATALDSADASLEVDDFVPADVAARALTVPLAHYADQGDTLPQDSTVCRATFDNHAPLTRLLVDLTTSVSAPNGTVALRAAADPFGYTCAQAAAMPGSHVDIDTCVTVSVNYTGVYREELYLASLWLNPVVPSGGSQQLYAPQVWRRYDAYAPQMATFPVSLASTLSICVILFDADSAYDTPKPHDPYRWQRSAVLQAAPGSTVLVAPNARGLPELSVQAGSGAFISVNATGHRAGWGGVVPYACVLLADQCVQVYPLEVGGPGVLLQPDSTTLHVNTQQLRELYDFVGRHNYDSLLPLLQASLAHGGSGYLGIQDFQPQMGGPKWRAFGPAQACAQSGVLNNCNGRGKCDPAQGACVCQSGWTGASCAESVPVHQAPAAGRRRHQHHKATVREA